MTQVNKAIRPDRARSGRRTLAMLLGAVLVAAAGGLAAGGPAPGPARIIGSNGAGCLAGAVELPVEGIGFQQIRTSRSTFWGYPETIARLELLAREAHAAGLPDLYMNDIAGPRGGPIPSHAGHEIGLEADIWLDVTPKPALPVALRDALDPPSVVRPDGRAVDPSVWRPEHAQLLRLAAGLPGVERLFVNPAIKRELCASTTGDRSWLRLIRPWYGHASHFHIRFRCPADQPECVEPAPVPPGDGCDASLQWWFDQLDHPAASGAPAAPRAPAPLPAGCRAILSAADR